MPGTLPTVAFVSLGDRQVSAPANTLGQTLNPGVDSDGVPRYQSDDITSTQFGIGAIAQSIGSMAIGAFSRAYDNGSISLGPNSQAKGLSSIALGDQARALGYQSIAIGIRSYTTYPHAISLGTLSQALGDQSICIGSQSKVSAGNDASIAIGYRSTVTGPNSSAVGWGTSIAGQHAVALGDSCSSPFDYSIAIGSDVTTTAANQCRIGDESTVPVKLLLSDMLQFIGTTVAYPALKRSGVNVQVRTANDAGFGGLEVVDDPYGVTWNGKTEVPTKNAVYDKIEAVIATIPSTPNITRADKIRLGNQVADIVATNFANTAAAGDYRVAWYLETTTADAAAGTITLTISWTDDVGVTTVTSVALSLAATGRTSGTSFIFQSAGVVTYAISHTGIYGTSQYALTAYLESLT